MESLRKEIPFELAKPAPTEKAPAPKASEAPKAAPKVDIPADPKTGEAPKGGAR